MKDSNVDIDKLLNCSYDDLIEVLFTSSKEEKKYILSNSKIKEILINCDNRHDFTWLAQMEDDDVIINLLKGDGLELLKDSDFFIDKLNAILTSGCSYVDKLFQDENFCNFINSYLFELKDYFYNLSNETSNSFFNYLIKNDEEEAISFLNEINTSSLKYIIENNNMDSKYYLNLSLIIASKDKQYAEKYLEENKSKFDYCEFNLNTMKNLICSNVTIPYEIIGSKKFIDAINNVVDIKEFRFLLNILEKNNDISYIERIREIKYEKQLNSYDREEKMMKKYLDCYKEIIKESPNKNEDGKYICIHSIIEKYFPSNNYIVFNDWYIFYDKIIKLYDESDFSKLKNFFIEESNYESSNIILDYLFKDIYYNVLIDMKELISFQEKVGLIIKKEKYNDYLNFLKIDELNHEEKIKIFNRLKNNNCVENFYDDLRNAKNLSYQMLKDEILNKDKLQKYKNNEASSKYGVNIYVLDGDPFYALVKSLVITKSSPLTDYARSIGDGSSFSIDGSDKLNCIEKPDECFTLLYDNFNIEQVVHTFPVDSFTNYNKQDGNNGTKRINKIMTPLEFVALSKNYNEMLLFKDDKNKYGFKDKTLSPKPIALYCYDEINEVDLITAKNLNIDIVVVKTKNYDRKNNMGKITIGDTSTYGRTIKYDYLKDIDQDAMFKRRKI